MVLRRRRNKYQEIRNSVRREEEEEEPGWAKGTGGATEEAPGVCPRTSGGSPPRPPDVMKVQHYSGWRESVPHAWGHLLLV